MVRMKMGKELSQNLILFMIIVSSLDVAFGFIKPGLQLLDSMVDNVITKSERRSRTSVLSHLNPFDSLTRQAENVHKNETSSGDVTTYQRRCHCSNGSCGCCSKFLLNMLRQRVCVNVTYDPDEFSFTTKIWMNDKALYTRTVSGKNPRPVCVPIPRIPLAEVCVRFYNIYFQGRNVHACLNTEGKFADTTIVKVGFDCVRFGANGLAIVKPEDGGGLGQIEFLPSYISGDNDDDSEEEYDDDEDDDADYFRNA